MFTNQRAVDICNSSLLEIGQDMIKGLHDNNPRSEACATTFHKDLEACLQMFSFEFSKKTITLTKLDGRDGYALPPKMITALGLRKTCSCCDACESFHLDSDVGIVISDSALYINKPTKCGCGCECDVLVYISADYENMPLSPLFDKALSLLIASSIAMKFTANISLKQRLFDEYNYWIKRAKQQQTVYHNRIGDACCDVPFFKCCDGYLK